MITLTLPWPPTVNTYYRHVGRKTLISKGGRAYRDAVCMAVIEQRAKRVEGRLAVHIVAYPPDRRRRDLDNLCKAALDALQHAGVFVDDGAIDDLSVYRSCIVAGGKIKVTVLSIGGKDAQAKMRPAV
jgi:crossover junction endodeoxyribonuclease RusA